MRYPITTAAILCAAGASILLWQGREPSGREKPFVQDHRRLADARTSPPTPEATYSTAVCEDVDPTACATLLSANSLACAIFLCPTCTLPGICNNTCGLCSSPSNLSPSPTPSPTIMQCEDLHPNTCTTLLALNATACAKMLCPTCPLAGICDQSCGVCVPGFTVTPTLSPSTASSKSPTSPITHVDVRSFQQAFCGDPAWSCAMPSGVSASNRGVLVLNGTETYVRLKEPLTSNRVIEVSGQFQLMERYDAANVIALATTPTGPSTGAYAKFQLSVYLDLDGAIGVPWTFCSSAPGIYRFDAHLSSDSTTVQIANSVGAQVCRVETEQGLAKLAPNGENLYFYFGSEAQHASATSTWLSISIKDASTSAPEAPTTPPATLVPTTGIVSADFREFQVSLCNVDLTWRCASPSATSASSDGQLVYLVGKWNFVRLAKSLASDRLIQASSVIRVDSTSSGHFMAVSTSSVWPTGDNFAKITLGSPVEITILGAMAAMSSTSTSSTCSVSSGDVAVLLLMSYDVTAVEVTTADGASCDISIAQGLSELAPYGRRLYFYFGTDGVSQTEATSWLSVRVTDSGSETAFAPTAVPTMSMIPTTSVVVASTDEFTNSSLFCNDGLWHCASPGYVSASDSHLLLYGSDNFIQLTTSLSSDRLIQISGKIRMDSASDDHFISVSTADSRPVDGSYLHVDLLTDIYVSGTSITTQSVSCTNTMGSYRFNLVLTPESTTINVYGAAQPCELVLAQGLRELAPERQRLYFYFGADTDSDSRAAAWLSVGVTDSGATAAPSLSVAPTALPTPSPSLTIAPTTTIVWTSIEAFNATFCDGDVWRCSTPGQTFAAGGALLLTGNFNSIRLGTSLASDRLIQVSGKIRYDSSTDYHFIALSTADSGPVDGSYFIVYLLADIHASGTSITTQSIYCTNTVGSYQFNLIMTPESTTINVYGASQPCELVLVQGFHELAPDWERLYFYFGADSDSSTQAAEWLSVSITDSGTTATPSVAPSLSSVPTALPSITLVPTSAIVSTEVAEFTSSPCDDRTWRCLSPSQTSATRGSLLLTGNYNFIQLAESLASDRLIQASGKIRVDSLEDDHFIALSTSDARPEDGRFLHVDLLDRIYAYGSPFSLQSVSCTAAAGTYWFKFIMTPESTTINVYGASRPCEVFLTQGLRDLAPDGQRVYFYFGADSDSSTQASEWLSVSVTDTGATAAPTISVAPTALPTPTPTASESPTQPVVTIYLRQFAYTLCGTSAWSCLSPAHTSYSGGQLILTGTLSNSNFLRLKQPLESKRLISIQGGFRMESTSNRHFVVLSTSSTLPTSGNWARIDFLTYLQVSGTNIPTASTYCGTSAGMYTFSVFMSQYEITVELVDETNASVCDKITTVQGIEAIAPQGEPLFFYFGADVNRDTSAARWLSIGVTDSAIATPDWSTATAPPVPTPSPFFSFPNSAIVETELEITSSLCDDPAWSCMSSGVVRLNAQLASHRFIQISGKIRLEGNEDSNFAAVSTADTWPSDGRYAYIELLTDVNVYGTISTSSKFCSSAQGVYPFAVYMTSDFCRVVIYNTLNGGECEVSTAQGLKQLAPEGQQLYVYFGASVDPTTSWLAVSVTDSDVTPAPSLSFKPTIRPSVSPTSSIPPTTSIVSISIDAFTSTFCYDDTWFCLSPSQSSASSGSLFLTGNYNFVRLIKSLTSDRLIQVSGKFRMASSEDDHFIALSTSDARPADGSYLQVDLLENLEASGLAFSSGLVYCTNAPGTYSFKLGMTFTSTTINVYGASQPCKLVLAQGLHELAPDGERLYFYFGADEDSYNQAAEWLSIEVTDSGATAAPSFSIAPTGLPTRLPTTTFTPTTSIVSITIAEFTNSSLLCNDELWHCASPSYLSASDGHLLLYGSDNFIQLTTSLSSDRLIQVSGKFRVDSAFDNHFIALSTADSRPVNGSYLHVDLLTDIYASGTSITTQSVTCTNAMGSYRFNLVMTPESTTINVYGAAQPCDLVLAQGLLELAPERQRLYFYFGADPDSDSHAAAWLSVGVTDSGATAAPSLSVAPTALPTPSPSLTIAPTTTIVWTSIEAFNATFCDGETWRCSTPGQTKTAGGTLLLTGNFNSIRLGTSLASDRLIQVSGKIRYDSSTDYHFISLSTADSGPVDGSYFIVYLLADIHASGTSITTQSIYCTNTVGIYSFQLLMTPESTTINVYGASQPCELVLLQGLLELEPDGQRLYFYFGADSDSSIQAAEWLAVSITDSGVTETPSAAPSLSPVPTLSPTVTPIPTSAIVSIEVEEFTSSPCDDQTWECTSPRQTSVAAGSLLLTGNFNFIQLAQSLASDRLIQVSGKIRFESSEDDHFIAVSTSDARPTDGRYLYVDLLDRIYTDGSLGSWETDYCTNAAGAFSFNLFMTPDSTTINVFGTQNPCQIVRTQGLRELAPDKQRLFFYFGADSDSLTQPAEWLSLSITDSGATMAPSFSTAPTAFPTALPTTTFAPTTSIVSISIDAFTATFCDDEMWRCLSRRQTSVADGSLFLAGNFNFILLTTSLASDRLVQVQGKIRMDSSSDDHFISLSTADSRPEDGSYLRVDLLENIDASGTSISSTSIYCTNTVGIYSFQLLMTPESTTINVYGASQPCELVLTLGLPELAPNGQRLYFYFGADSDSLTHASEWLSVSVTNSGVTAAPSISVAPTVVPTVSPSLTWGPVTAVSISQFQTAICTSGLWVCSSPSHVLVSNDELKLAGTGTEEPNFLRLASPLISSRLIIEASADLRFDAISDGHFISISTSPDGPTRGNHIFIQLLPNLEINRSTNATTSSEFCLSTPGFYHVDVHLAPSKIKVEVTVPGTELSCSIAVVGEGLLHLAPTSERLYFYFGAKQDFFFLSSTWLALSVTDALRTLPPSSWAGAEHNSSATPTRLPTPEDLPTSPPVSVANSGRCALLTISMDESSVMTKEHAWIRYVTLEIIRKIEEHIDEVSQTALCVSGYGSEDANYWARDLGCSARITNPADFDREIAGFRDDAFLVDGILGVDFAIDQADAFLTSDMDLRCHNVTKIGVLVTDAARDVVYEAFTASRLSEDLKSGSWVLNVVVNMGVENILGVDRYGRAFVTNISAEGNYEIAEPSTLTLLLVDEKTGTIKQDYINPAFSSDGIAWSIDALRGGGRTSRAFSEAFVDEIVGQVLRSDSASPSTFTQAPSVLPTPLPLPVVGFLGLSFAGSFAPGQIYVEWEAATVEQVGDTRLDDNIEYTTFLVPAPYKFPSTLVDIRADLAAAMHVELTTRELNVTVSSGLSAGTLYECVVIAHVDTIESLENRESVQVLVASQTSRLKDNITFTEAYASETLSIRLLDNATILELAGDISGFANSTTGVYLGGITSKNEPFYARVMGPESGTSSTIFLPIQTSNLDDIVEVLDFTAVVDACRSDFPSASTLSTFGFEHSIRALTLTDKYGPFSITESATAYVRVEAQKGLLGPTIATLEATATYSREIKFEVKGAETLTGSKELWQSRKRTILIKTPLVVPLVLTVQARIDLKGEGKVAADIATVSAKFTGTAKAVATNANGYLTATGTAYFTDNIIAEAPGRLSASARFSIPLTLTFALYDAVGVDIAVEPGIAWEGAARLSLTARPYLETFDINLAIAVPLVAFIENFDKRLLEVDFGSLWTYTATVMTLPSIEIRPSAFSCEKGLAQLELEAIEQAQSDAIITNGIIGPHDWEVHLSAASNGWVPAPRDLKLVISNALSGTITVDPPEGSVELWTKVKYPKRGNILAKEDLSTIFSGGFSGIEFGDCAIFIALDSSGSMSDGGWERATAEAFNLARQYPVAGWGRWGDSRSVVKPVGPVTTADLDSLASLPYTSFQGTELFQGLSLCAEFRPVQCYIIGDGEWSEEEYPGVKAEIILV